jgi:hypothetical protein
MRYITTPERIGRRIGREEGRQDAFQQVVISVLDERFGKVPPEIAAAIHQIEGQDKLKSLARQAIRSASLDEFKQALNGGAPAKQ